MIMTKYEVEILRIMGFNYLDIKLSNQELVPSPQLSYPSWLCKKFRNKQ